MPFYSSDSQLDQPTPLDGEEAMQIDEAKADIYTAIGIVSW